MASRPIFTPYSVITDGSMAGNLTSKVTIIQNLSMVSYDISWSGTTPVGEITVQVSNTYSQNADGSVRNAGTWHTLVLSDETLVSGNTGDGFIDVDANAAYAIRLIYTRTSGTGTLNVTINGKVA